MKELLPYETAIGPATVEEATTGRTNLAKAVTGEPFASPDQRAETMIGATPRLFSGQMSGPRDTTIIAPILPLTLRHRSTGARSVRTIILLVLRTGIARRLRTSAGTCRDRMAEIGAEGSALGWPYLRCCRWEVLLRLSRRVVCSSREYPRTSHIDCSFSIKSLIT